MPESISPFPETGGAVMSDEVAIAQRTAGLRSALDHSDLQASPARPCPYLAGRTARDVVFRARALPPGVYRSLMDLNFRRSGDLIYRPACEACDQCRAIRLPVAAFRPDRSQRRCLAGNADLEVEVDEPRPTPEKHRLYVEYLAARHDGQMDASWEGFRGFLYRSPIETAEVVFRDAGRLVGVGLLDLDDNAISTVYFYFDPRRAARSPGTFNILWTVELARRLGVEYVYLGYDVRDCPKMHYKTRFRPCEILDPDFTWRRIEPHDGQ